jgi:hypothetical protein
MSPIRSRNEVLEVRNVDGLLHIARKIKRPDEWNPPYESYDPYGPGEISRFHLLWVASHSAKSLQ